jgi:hypothetical protein
MFQLNVEPYSSFTDSSDNQLWQHGLFLVSVDDKPKNATKEKSPDYYANVGDAIRTLREDIPLLFERELNCAHHQSLVQQAVLALQAHALLT